MNGKSLEVNFTPRQDVLKARADRKKQEENTEKNKLKKAKKEAAVAAAAGEGKVVLSADELDELVKEEIGEESEAEDLVIGDDELSAIGEDGGDGDAMGGLF